MDSGMFNGLDKIMMAIAFVLLCIGIIIGLLLAWIF